MTVKLRWYKNRDGKDFSLPEIVESSIRKSFAHSGKVEEILDDLQYNSLCDYWWFRWLGMHVGIERDGYIHT